MSNTVSAHVVSARAFGADDVVYFDGSGQWTTDLHRAHVARSATARKAMFRVAAGLANGASIGQPTLTEIRISPTVSAVVA